MHKTCDVGSDIVPLRLLSSLGTSEESQTQIETFWKQLKHHGFVVVRNEDSEYKRLLDELYALSKEFFLQDPTFKSKLATNVTDNGYNLRPGVKESLMVRLAEGSTFPFRVDRGGLTEEEKDLMSRLESKVLQYYRTMFEISKTCLAVIAHSLGIPSEKLWAILEPELIPKGEYSTATLRLFHYFNLEGGDEPCYDHNDLGFLTLIPCSSVPGLQMAKYCSNCTDMWVDVERVASHEEHDIVVFVGETMTRLLNGYLIAALHRVTSNPENVERFSLPFLVKGWPTAVLDSNSLGCENLIGKSYQRPEYVDDFMRMEQGRRQSVNNLY